jgi:hypothetical protein
MNAQDSLAALDGLRGIAALWVLLHHCGVYGTSPIDLQGSSIMPLFFLLSGFTLTIVYSEDNAQLSYQVLNTSLDSSDHHLSTVVSNPIDGGLDAGKARPDGDSINDGPPAAATAQKGGSHRPLLEATWASWMRFQQNRFARVYPLYLLGTLLCLVFWLYGYGSVAATDTLGLTLSVATSVVPLSPTFLLLLGGPIDGPGWTVCTLLAMWLFFPVTFRALKVRDLARYVFYAAGLCNRRSVLLLTVDRRACKTRSGSCPWCGGCIGCNWRSCWSSSSRSSGPSASGPRSAPPRCTR